MFGIILRIRAVARNEIQQGAQSILETKAMDREVGVPVGNTAAVKTAAVSNRHIFSLF